MPSLIGDLDRKIGKLSNLNRDWYQFILDHKYYLIESGDEIPITDEDRSRYKFKLIHFLRDRKVNKAILWIVILINDLDINDDFTRLSSIIIPNYSTIAGDMFRKFKTSSKIKEAA